MMENELVTFNSIGAAKLGDNLNLCLVFRSIIQFKICLCSRLDSSRFLGNENEGEEALKSFKSKIITKSLHKQFNVIAWVRLLLGFIYRIKLNISFIKL